MGSRLSDSFYHVINEAFLCFKDFMLCLICGQGPESFAFCLTIGWVGGRECVGNFKQFSVTFSASKHKFKITFISLLPFFCPHFVSISPELLGWQFQSALSSKVLPLVLLVK